MNSPLYKEIAVAAVPGIGLRREDLGGPNAWRRRQTKPICCADCGEPLDADGNCPNCSKCTVVHKADQRFITVQGRHIPIKVPGGSSAGSLATTSTSNS